MVIFRTFATKNFGNSHFIVRRSTSTVLTTVALRGFSKQTNGERDIRLPPTFLIFGSNTDIGKTVLSAALVRAASVTPPVVGGEMVVVPATNVSARQQGRSNNNRSTHYIKPLQCGGSDEAFIRKHVPTDRLSSAKTLFRWETPASPHVASRIENYPVSDEQVLTALTDYVEGLTRCTVTGQDQIHDQETMSGESTLSPLSSIWIETAGGVLSPSSSSPFNTERYHATNPAGWGWVPQADLYRPLREVVSVILIGDGRLGGISATLSSLEALVTRGYSVSGVLMIRPSGEGGDQNHTNKEALQEYAYSVASSTKGASYPVFENPSASILSLPTLPPEPEPLMDWYTSPEVERLTSFVHDHLFHTWRQQNNSMA
jgi:dethiobiotin synthetase/adenosylmethionine--8-amino-7-oxononanoate aminotransferase